MENNNLTIEVPHKRTSDTERVAKMITLLGTLTERGKTDMVALKDAFALARNLETEELTKITNADGSIDKIFHPENFKAAHDYSKKIRIVSTQWIKQTGSAEMADLHRDTLLFDSRYDFDSYCRYLEWNRPKQKKFYEPRRFVLKMLAQDLQDLFDDKLDMLTVSMPPRTGKSTLCIFFMSFLMGNRPLVANVMSGHSDKLTEPFYRELLNIVTDKNTYNWADIFPDVIVKNTSAKNETIDLNTNKRFPSFTARAVGGTLTGAVEVGDGGLLYLDDLVEDLEESMSPERLQKKYDAYLNQLKDRKKDGAKELMVGTRWNVLDPIGRVQEQYRDNPRYRFRVMPALNEEGESNFDYPYGLGFSTEYYLDMKQSIDDATWCAKYMGSPYIREGLLFARETLRRYFELPDGDPDAIWAVCDPAQGGGDDTFLPVMFQYGDDHYMVDCICDDSLPEVTDIRCAEILTRYKVRRCQYESNAAGTRTAANVQSLIKDQKGITKIITKHTQSNKDTKILANSTWVKQHVLFKDDTIIENKTDYQKAMRLLTMYTAMGGKKERDDVPDGLTQYAEFIIDSVASVVEIRKRII